jgi:hypothetical protein
LDADALAELAVRGLAILLANDCELLGAWMRELRAPKPLVASRPASRVVVVVLGAPDEVAPLPAAGDLPLTLDEAVSRADVLGTAFRAAEAD